MNGRHHKYSDRIIAVLLIFVLPAIVIYFVDFSTIISEEYDGVAVSGIMLGVWGAMLGFMITALSIIMTLGDGDFIRILRKTSHFKTIMFIMILSCTILFLATVFGAAIVCFNLWSSGCFNILLYFLFGTGISILLSMFYLFFIVINCNS